MQGNVTGRGDLRFLNVWVKIVRGKRGISCSGDSAYYRSVVLEARPAGLPDGLRVGRGVVGEREESEMSLLFLACSADSIRVPCQEREVWMRHTWEEEKSKKQTRSMTS